MAWWIYFRGPTKYIWSKRVRLQVKTQLCESLILQIVLYGSKWSRALKYVGHVTRMPVQPDELPSLRLLS